MICRFCEKYNTCTTLCDEMTDMLSNSKKNNGTYSDSTVEFMNVHFEDNILEQILYTSSISSDVHKRVERVIIAILSPEQKQILQLISESKNQEEIGTILGITQSGVSQKIKTIKNEIRNQFVEILENII